MAKSADILDDAKEAFKTAQDAEAQNRADARADIEFARLTDQWPEAIRRKRDLEQRPCLTINMLPKFMRQVMNDIRQNRPAIKVRPVDGAADIKTADVYTGLIRNIEQQSHSDTAWDTAAEHAISGGFGYCTISVDHAYDDTFDQDIRINRVANQFSVYGDPNDMGADSRDWNSAFQVELIGKDEFKRRFKGAEASNWDDGDVAELKSPWREGDDILIAGWWVREPIVRKLLKLSNGRVVAAEDYAKVNPETGLSQRDIDTPLGITVVTERDAPSFKVTHHLLTGAEVLKTTPWPGRYIPIIPVYGEEINLDGRRILKSLIRDAKDPQINFNYWRTAATELIALAPKAPWVGPVGSFETDPNWATANTDTHQFLEYDPVGPNAPQRIPFAGIPAGALNQAMLATDDMKSVIGMYDASLGQKSNETSGKAIMARQREGDVATFHFSDNLSRAIRHAGTIILDLIPKVYSGERMVRILGEDGKAQTVQLGPKPQAQPGQQQPGAPLQSMEGQPQPGQEPSVPSEVFDLTAGKYDLVVQAGPSYTTRREETAAALTEMIRAYPQGAAALAPTLLKSLDVPGIDEISAKLEQAAANGPNGPEQQKIQAELQKLAGENAALKSENQLMKAQSAAEKQVAQIKEQLTQAAGGIEQQKLAIDKQNADTARIKADADLIAAKTAAAPQGITATSETPDMAKLISMAMAEAMSKIQVSMTSPRMRRTAVRDHNGFITHTVDEPLDGPMPGTMMQ